MTVEKRGGWLRAVSLSAEGRRVVLRSSFGATERCLASASRSPDGTSHDEDELEPRAAFNTRSGYLRMGVVHVHFLLSRTCIAPFLL